MNTALKISVGLVLVAFCWLLFVVLSPVSLKNEEVRFVVPLDTKNAETINRLKDENFIRSEKIFSVILLLVHFPGNIEPGAYLLNRNMNQLTLANTLLFRPYQKWALVKPGLRKEQTAEVVGKVLNWNEVIKREFISSTKEGYLFPDTYLFGVDDTAADAIARFNGNFNEKFDAQMQNDLLAQDIRNDTAIKIASLIERESGGDDDKALISGIIWNRLQEGMKLQIDASIQYAMGLPGDWWPRVKKSDYRLDSEYNTYKIPKLPPSPICSPGLASIKAAVYPKATDCFYYLHSPDKKIHCAVTYKEHLENIERYLK